MPCRITCPLILSAMVFGLSACGGGGGSGSGMLIEGTLTEAGGGHELVLFEERHSAGQRIGKVRICALDTCSTTDDEGQWGFVAPEDFTGGSLSFSVNGHGISTISEVAIRPGTREVFIEFLHVDGSVEAGTVTFDGEKQETPA